MTTLVFKISPREQDVLEYLRQGYNQKEIANILQEPPHKIDHAISALRKRFNEEAEKIAKEDNQPFITIKNTPSLMAFCYEYNIFTPKNSNLLRTA